MRNQLRAAFLCVALLALPASVVRAQGAGQPAEPTYPDVSYGPAKRNVLDFYQARTNKPAPLLVHIHGGAFVSGDKRAGMNVGLVQMINGFGVHLASINYQFVDGKDVIFPAPQHDGARAVQFLRSKAGEWNIDPKRVACFGGSAGAGIGMWVAFHDDMADPDNPDPVLRQSTRLLAVGSLAGQTTYDPIKIKKLIGGRTWEHPSLFKIYGVKDANEALHPSPEQKRLYDECAAITWLTKDDPPVFMIYSEADGPLPADAKPGDGIHHPNFGRMLKERMDELGIENVFINQNAGKNQLGDPNRQMFDFLWKHLGVRSVRRS
jgi:acetyl esterase/lipase